MKNISERENQEQFEGFHKMLYELAETGLAGTQFIVIDKEFCAPSNGTNISLSMRHMTPEDPIILHWSDTIEVISVGSVSETSAIS